MIAFVALSLFITPPILWYVLYRSIVPQQDPNDFNPQLLNDRAGEPYLQYRWLTKKEAQAEVLKKTLRHPLTYAWAVYAFITVWAITMCATH